MTGTGSHALVRAARAMIDRTDTPNSEERVALVYATEAVERDPDTLSYRAALDAVREQWIKRANHKATISRLENYTHMNQSMKADMAAARTGLAKAESELNKLLQPEAYR